MITDAVKTREGALYLAGAAVFGVLALLLLVDTVEDYAAQWEVREAAQAFAQRQGNARELLLAIRGGDASDATSRVLLGVHEMERARGLDDLFAARSLFEEALQLEPGRTSAAVGLIAARLREVAHREPGARRTALQEVRSLADQLAREAEEPQHPDLVYLLATIPLLQGQAEEALQQLEREPDDALPSRAGHQARFHNLAVARILAHRPGAAPAAALAHTARLWPTPGADAEDEPEPEEPGASAWPNPRGEAARLLVAAYRSDLADPRVLPQDPAGLAARCLEVDRLVAGASRAGGPHMPPRAQAPAILNALGLAWYRADRPADAAAAFGRASSLERRKEPLYLLNEAQAATRAGLAAGPGSEERAKLLGQAMDAYLRVGELLEDQPNRAGTVALAATNGASLGLELDEPARGRQLYERFVKVLPDEAQAARDLGALWDHCRNQTRARRWYDKAFELNHPESGALRQRVRTNER